jgi:hypothetical protein
MPGPDRSPASRTRRLAGRPVGAPEASGRTLPRARFGRRPPSARNMASHPRATQIQRARPSKREMSERQHDGRRASAKSPPQTTSRGGRGREGGAKHFAFPDFGNAKWRPAPVRAGACSKWRESGGRTPECGGGRKIKIGQVPSIPKTLRRLERRQNAAVRLLRGSKTAKMQP